MSSTKFKLIAVIVTLVITLAFFLHSTFAYFTDAVVTPKSVIATGSTSVEIVQSEPVGGEQMPDGSLRIMPGQIVEKTVSIKNTGTLPLYVRVKVAPNIVLAEAYEAYANEIDYSLIGFDFDQTNWLYQDGYYHYRISLLSEKQAESLFTQIQFSRQMGNIYKDAKLFVTVRIEVVQANNNGDSVLTATGWAVASEGGAV
ncbi:MAG: hypothetical protein E7381_03375 [Clostridiales bacterium]|nr:hypothetical protein [Clostridiales bacterium]